MYLRLLICVWRLSLVVEFSLWVREVTSSILVVAQYFCFVTFKKLIGTLERCLVANGSLSG